MDLTKKLALTKAEMKVVNKVEIELHRNETRVILEDVPQKVDKNDLTESYLKRQVSSISHASLPTLKTRLEFSHKPTERRPPENSVPFVSGDPQNTANPLVNS